MDVLEESMCTPELFTFIFGRLYWELRNFVYTSVNIIMIYCLLSSVNKGRPARHLKVNSVTYLLAPVPTSGMSGISLWLPLDTYFSLLFVLHFIFGSGG